MISLRKMQKYKVQKENSSPRKTAVEDFNRRIAEIQEETHFQVFVCGPAINRSASNKKCNGATIRTLISKKMSQEGITVVWVEHLVSKNESPNIKKYRFDNAEKEVIFAVKHADLVIIFPASPGSFAELGAFSINPKIAHKMIIVFDSRYKDKKSFVVTAVAKSAKKRKAIIKFMNYATPTKVWKGIERALVESRDVKALGNLYATN